MDHGPLTIVYESTTTHYLANFVHLFMQLVAFKHLGFTKGIILNCLKLITNQQNHDEKTT